MRPGAAGGYDARMNVQGGPVGVFDSGVGGLSVVRELRALLPSLAIVYYADSAFCPYGEREPATILARSLAIADTLLARGARLLVVACNTASAVALEPLRRRHPAIPIIGLVPAVKPAVALSRSGRIAVLATPTTVRGGLLGRVIREHAGGATILTVPAPGLAELVEASETDGAVVEATLRPLLAPPLAAGIDTLVLGCTHYPFLAAPIQRLAGSHVTLVDSGAAIARRTRDVLSAGAPDVSEAPDRQSGGTLTLLTSGDPTRLAAANDRLLGTLFRTGAARR